MIAIEKPWTRVTVGALDGSYGLDRGRRLVATFLPGDRLQLRPLGTRRPEIISLFDVYRFAVRARANLEYLIRARAAKERKAARLAALRQLRAERRLFPKPKPKRP